MSLFVQQMKGHSKESSKQLAYLKLQIRQLKDNIEELKEESILKQQQLTRLSEAIECLHLWTEGHTKIIKKLNETTNLIVNQLRDNAIDRIDRNQRNALENGESIDLFEKMIHFESCIRKSTENTINLNKKLNVMYIVNVILSRAFFLIN